MRTNTIAVLWMLAGCGGEVQPQPTPPPPASAVPLVRLEGSPLPPETRGVLESSPPPSVALCMAAANGELDEVRRLAADAEERACTLPSSFQPAGVARSSALMLAAKFGHMEVVRHLLSVGMDPLARDTVTHRSAFIHAAAGNQVPIVELFWSDGRRPPVDDPHLATVLWWAATHDRRDVLEHYVSQGADPHLQHYGVTPLEAAARASHPETARWLRAHGAER